MKRFLLGMGRGILIAWGVLLTLCSLYCGGVCISAMFFGGPVIASFALCALSSIFARCCFREQSLYPWKGDVSDAH